jgi:hypothetical protein
MWTWAAQQIIWIDRSIMNPNIMPERMKQQKGRTHG